MDSQDLCDIVQACEARAQSSSDEQKQIQDEVTSQHSALTRSNDPEILQKRRWDATTPIAKLSSEILLIIFTFYIREAQSNYNGPLDPPSAPRHPYQYITISHICTHWRALIVNYPAFWNWIVPTSPSLTKMLLERSQQMPLLVQYLPPGGAFMTNTVKALDLESLKLVSAHFYRAKMITLCGNPAGLRDIDAPLLEDLTYYHGISGAHTRQIFIAHNDGSPQDVISFLAKGLKRLSLRACPFESTSRLLATTVQELDLCNVINPPTPRQMADLLANMPNLICIQLQAAISAIADPLAVEQQSHVVSLPRLQKLFMMELATGISSLMLLSYLDCQAPFVTITVGPSFLSYPWLGLSNFFAQSLLRALHGPLVGLRVQCRALSFTPELVELTFALYTIEGAAVDVADLQRSHIASASRPSPARFLLQLHVHYDIAEDVMLSMCCELAGPNIVDLSVQHEGISFLYTGFWYVVARYMPGLKNLHLGMEAATGISDALEREYSDDERASIQAKLRRGHECVEVPKHVLVNLAVLSIVDARWRMNTDTSPANMTTRFPGRPDLFTRMVAALKVRRERGLQLPELRVYTTEVPWRPRDLETMQTGDLVGKFQYTEDLTFERRDLPKQVSILRQRKEQQFARLKNLKTRLPPEDERIDTVLARLFMGCIELICEHINRLIEAVSKPQDETESSVLPESPETAKSEAELALEAKVMGDAYTSLDRLQDHLELMSTRLTLAMNRQDRAESEAEGALASGHQDEDNNNNDEEEEEEEDNDGDGDQDEADDSDEGNEEDEDEDEDD